MKKRIIVALLCLPTILLAQHYKFGKVSLKELQEKYYPLDSSAAAAYLNKYERRYYDFTSNGIILVTEITERIKIYTKEGFQYATRMIPYYNPDTGNSDKLSPIKAYTYFLNGNKIEKVKLKKENIFKEKVNSLFSAKKITMPNIKEGVVIEIKYSNRSPYITSIDDVNFQYAIPTKNYFCQLEIPEIFRFSKRSRGYYIIPMKQSLKNTTIEGLGANVFTFEGENIPALNDKEPFVYSYNDYRGGVDFELASVDMTAYGGRFTQYNNSWHKVAQQTYKSSRFGGQLKKTNFFKEDLATLVTKATTPVEKTALIFNYVKSKIKWNGNYGKFTQNGLKKAYKERVGNVADINLTLVAMLREAGIKANPVLVSTKSNGKSFFPSIDSFNYVICSVDFNDGTYIVLDATEPFSTANVLPERDLNWKGRKIAQDGSSSFINLTSKKYDSEENNINIKITEDMRVEGVMRTKLNYLNALNYRKKYSITKEEALIGKFEDSNQLEIEEFKVLNVENLNKQIVRNLKFSSENLLEEINGKFYVAPLLFLSTHENPFKKEERSFPVDYITRKKYNNSVSIQIPEGYKVTQLPESTAFVLPDKLGVFKFQTQQNGNMIRTRCIFQINQPLILPQYYPYLKSFYSEMIKKESEKIVFERI